MIEEYLGKIEVIYEDNHLLAINKPFCMPSQGDLSNDLSAFDWVKNYIRDKYKKPGEVYLGQLHRIDRPVGGVLLFARTSKAAARMSEMFQQKKVQKKYLAITEKIPAEPEGQLVHYLKKEGEKNIVKAFIHEVRGAKKSILNYKLLKTAGSRALLEVDPVTGRQHQIRVQLARMGCVIAGDVKYGKTEFNFDRSIALISKSATFEHPVTHAMITIEAPLPDNEIWKPFH